MNRTARLLLILSCGVVLLVLSFIYPSMLFLWLLLTLLALLIGMLLLYPQEKQHAFPADAVQMERAQLEAAINSMPVGFMVINANHNLVTLNASAQSLLHVVPPLHTDLFYNNLPIITKNFTMQKLEEIFAETIDLKGMIDECILQKKPIEKRDVVFGKKYLHLMLSPVVVFKKRPESVGCVLLIEDATATRLLEKSRDDFFSIAAHELRTPLTAIRGNASLMQQYSQDQIKEDRYKRMLGDIHESSVRLIAIVNEYLDTSRLEQQKIQFTKESVDLSALLTYLVKEYQPTAKEKKLSLSLQKGAANTMVLGDADKIKQIIINLLGNSLKHTQKGGISLAFTPEGSTIEIRITDTGSGIPDEAKKKLFTKFQRVENTPYTKEVNSGSGLGLYIARLLAEGMGGRILLEKTELGKGSTFMLSLPKG